MSDLQSAVGAAAWLRAADCRLDDFVALVERSTDLADYPFAAEVVDNVVVYDGDALRAAGADPSTRRAVQAELARALLHGPGVVAFRRAFADTAPVDAVTDAFFSMVAEQHALGRNAGDHYAKPGANDRVWNVLEKLARRAPEAFVAYYANEPLALVSEAWLGPAYQVTSQVNVVNPGGEAQSPHRDYHLGFLTDEVAEQYPAHVHALSPVLTLQGAVAHCDMPVESGPTLYLPYSQQYLPGYLAWRREEFRAYFEAHRVQLPLAKGDAAFFNPALFHAAGHNRTTDIKRIANLLQVSSAFGRAMESMDKPAMLRAIYPALVQLASTGTAAAVRNVVTTAGDGYPFPTNLDRDQPLGRLTPISSAELVTGALAAGWSADAFDQALAAYVRRRDSGVGPDGSLIPLDDA